MVAGVVVMYGGSREWVVRSDFLPGAWRVYRRFLVSWTYDLGFETIQGCKRLVANGL